MRNKLTKITFTAVFGLAIVFTPSYAQDRNASIGGSIGYMRAVIDGLEDYPFEGFGFNLGTSGFIPLSDVAKFGGGVYFNYFTASAKDEYDVELTLSGISLGFTPTIRFGEDKTYADIGLEISMPLSEEITMKVPGYGSQTEKNDDTENTFAVILRGRLKIIGLGIGKVLTGSDKAIVLQASPFISITEQSEIVPSISYSMGDTGNQLNLSIGFEHWF